MTTKALALSQRLSLARLAYLANLHPDLVRRVVALGLPDADHDAVGRLWFAPKELSNVARIERLRAGLALNYAAIGLVLDLLDRVHELQAADRRRSAAPWT